MKHRERVQKTIAHGVPDRIPFGELEIPLTLVGKFLRRPIDKLSLTEEFNLRREFLSALDMDLVVVPGYQWVDGQSLFRELSLKEINLWCQQTDYFVFGLVNGGFGQALCTYDLSELMLSVQKEPIETARLIEGIIKENTAIAEMMVDAGAQAIIIGDDFAYAKGTFVNPILLRQILFPAMRRAIRKIKSRGVPVFLHVDGNINDVLQDVIDLGIDGLHSIQPTAGMDIAKLKALYGQKICLMGNLDLELFYNDNKEALATAVSQLIEVAAPGGGFILSTSSGLEENIIIEQLLFLKELLSDTGEYSQQKK